VQSDTRRAYGRALGKFMRWCLGHGHRELSRLVLEQYRADLERSQAAASINQELSALRHMLRSAATAGLVDADRAVD
jgi:site-specific recombinase XerD